MKLVLKDLPLHEISNDQVLAALKRNEDIDVQSQVWYSNIYIDGHRTHLRNRDRFIYVIQESSSRLGKSVLIDGYQARVIKPVVLSRCSRCQ